MINFVIGRDSNLSRQLEKILPDTRLISSRAISMDANAILGALNRPCNVILNNFWPATRLNDLSDPEAFVEASVGVTAKALKAIGENKQFVNRVVYTSSASVYGNAGNCRTGNVLQASSLHAALKISNEKLVEKFCLDNGVDYTIARVFNMFGGDDRFSIINKIILAIQQDEILKLINNGSAVRDFIHIDDIARAFALIVKQDSPLPIVNIGTGHGLSVRSILADLEKAGIRVEASSEDRAEIAKSIADTTELMQLIGEDYEFIHPVDYILGMCGR